MKKLLSVLLAVLMVLSIGVVNVAAEDAEPVVEVIDVDEEVVDANTAHKDDYKATAHIGVVTCDNGIYGAIAYGVKAVKDAEGKDVVLTKENLQTYRVFIGDTFYYLDDVEDVVRNYESKLPGYQFSGYFGEAYVEDTKTCGLWALVGLTSGRRYRYTDEDIKCYAIFTKIPTYQLIIPPEVVLSVKGIVAKYTGEAQTLLTKVPAVDDCDILYSIDGGQTWSLEVPTGTNADEYEILYKAVVKEGGKYDTKDVVWEESLPIKVKAIIYPADYSETLAILPNPAVSNIGSDAELNINANDFPGFVFEIDKLDGTKEWSPLEFDKDGNFNLEKGAYIIKVSDPDGNYKPQYKKVVISEEGADIDEAYVLELEEGVDTDSKSFEVSCSRGTPDRITIDGKEVTNWVDELDDGNVVVNVKLAKGDHNVVFHYDDGMHVDGVITVKAAYRPPYVPVKTGVE